MRARVLWAVLALMLAGGGLVAMESVQERMSDRQLRQRLGYSLAQIRGARTAIDAAEAHVQGTWDAVNARVVTDSLADLEPVPEPPPPPPPDTTTEEPPPVMVELSPVLTEESGGVRATWRSVPGVAEYAVRGEAGGQVVTSTVADTTVWSPGVPEAARFCVSALEVEECVDWISDGGEEPAPEPAPEPQEPTPDPEGITTLVSLRWQRTGSSVEAWTDGDPSRNYWCNSSTIDPRVVPGGEVGWMGPGNVFTTRNTTGGCGGLLLDRVFPRLPQAGDTWVWRYYYRQDAQSFSHQHGLGDLNPVGSIDLTFHRTYSFGGGTWNHLLSAPPADFGWNMLDNTDGVRGSYSGGWSRWTRLRPDTWYRFTFVMQWASSTQYRLYVRVHDPDGRLVATEANYVADYVGGQGSPQKLSDFYDRGGYLQRRSGGDTTRESIRNWYLGVAQSKSANAGRHYYAAADVGVCASLVERCFYGTP